MQWDLDSRGDAINLQITYREIARRKWHSKHSDRIPPIWRDAVARVIREHHQTEERRELLERFGGGAGRRRVELRERLARADEATRARQKERRDG